MSFYNFMSSAANASLNRGPKPVGGWVELGRSSGSSQLDVSSLDDKRYYMVLLSEPSGNIAFSYYLNTDSGSNYSRRYSNDGGSPDGTDISQTSLFGSGLTFGDYNQFMVSYISNLSGNEKLGITHIASGQTTGASNAPSRWEGVSKWANTSNAINRIQTEGTMTDSNSEMVVLGWDPDDTHTNNFWEELASDSPTGSAGESMDVSFTAKKYLWVQWYIDADSPYSFSQMRVGNSSVDTGSNYATRYSINGATDGTGTSADKWDLNASTLGAGEQEFGNMFIINNASNEKLMMCWIGGNNTGAGAANAPHRSEWTGKWDNTSNQIDTIQMLTNGSDTKTSKSFIKVWGAD